MKLKLIILCTLLTMFSCVKDDATNPTCEVDIIPPVGEVSNEDYTGKTLAQGSLFDEDECVAFESITSSNTGFTMLDKGFQEEGKAKGIKINEPWEASTFLYGFDSSFSIVVITYWVWGPTQVSYVTGEFMRLASIPANNPVGCYYLTSNESTADSIQCIYSMKEYDITLLDYKLDESKENKLEIIEYNQATGVLKAKMKASFITDESSGPEFPEKVRFFNVDIETY